MLSGFLYNTPSVGPSFLRICNVEEYRASNKVYLNKKFSETFGNATFTREHLQVLKDSRKQFYKFYTTVF